MKIFQILARPFVAFVERYYPDAFIFVIILSIITFLSALVLTDATPSSALVAWGDGLSMLFTFTAQITIIMIGAHSLAHTELVQNFLTRIGQLPNTASQAYSLVAFTAGVASLCAWSFGLIIGAIVARSVANTLPVISRISLFRICYLAYGLLILIGIICCDSRASLRKQDRYHPSYRNNTLAS